MCALIIAYQEGSISEKEHLITLNAYRRIQAIITLFWKRGAYKFENDIWDITDSSRQP